MIVCQQVSVNQGKQVILQQVDLMVEAQQCFSLVGVNGAGKSTLIKTLLDMLDVESGSINIDGVPHISFLSRQSLAYLPERFVPPYYLKGVDFLHYMLKLYQQSVDETKIVAMCDALNFDKSALHRSVRTYSKGMAQKLGLIACFLSGKQLYILDEPMSGLDPKARVLVKKQLNMLKAQGATVFFTSHLLADVDELADKMAILHEGRIQFQGTPSQCREQFQSENLEFAFMACIGY